jgi:hypothetical protein
LIPSILKVNPVVEELTAIDPVATVQVGWLVALVVGAAGLVGGEFTVTLFETLMHPLVFLAVKL